MNTVKMDRAGAAMAFVGASVALRLRARQRRSKPQKPVHIVDLVRQTCEYAANELSHYVTIEREALAKIASSSWWGKPPLWDEFDWHCSVAVHGPVITARYVFVLDALNYCFWPTSEQTGLEYENLARGLRKACENGDNFLNLRHCTMERLKSWLEKPHEFPLLESRLDAIQKLGVAFDKYGDALDWIKESNNSAASLVDLVQARLVSFKDEEVLNGKRICFYKRAQILVADVWAAFGQKATGLGGFNDMSKLTMFADYRVPQLLRDLGVLCYSDKLAILIDCKVEIAKGSLEEIAIRAATVHALELIRKESGGKLTSVEVDWILWQQGEGQKHTLRPHHRTLTTCY